MGRDADDVLTDARAEPNVMLSLISCPVYVSQMGEWITDVELLRFFKKCYAYGMLHHMTLFLEAQ